MDVYEVSQVRNDLTEMFKRAYKNNRLSHAYLFNGEEGTGKKELAYYFTCMLYCKSEVAPCLKCPDCLSILKNEHLNLVYIQKDGQGIKKEQIIALQNEFSMTSLLDGPRIYIIDGIDKISTQAANSLLKFIEEPLSSNTYGILLTDDISKVLPTIISRSSIINFPSIKKSEVATALCSEQIDPLIATIVSYLTNNITEAKELCLSEDIIKLSEVIKNYLIVDNPKDLVLFMKANTVFFDSKENIIRFLSILTIIYEDILKLYYNVENISFKSLMSSLLSYVKRYDIIRIKTNFKKVLEYNQRLEYNVLPKLLLQQLLINLF